MIWMGKRAQSKRLSDFIHLFLLLCGVWSLEPVKITSPFVNFELPWQKTLCCDSPAKLYPEKNNSETNLFYWNFRRVTSKTMSEESSVERPNPPVNLSHFQTDKGELIVHWKDPSDRMSGPLTYELQISTNESQPSRQLVPVSGQPRVSLNLKPEMKYIIQVRCSRLVEPPLWSKWSEPYSFYIGVVTYVPEQVVATTGAEVTVFCVFNDRKMNSSTAVWRLNNQDLDPSLSYPVNKWVSQITFRVQETGISNMLQCRNNTIPYSIIYVPGAFLDITCETNGDMDAMKCTWTKKEHYTLKLLYKWASCDVIEEETDSGEESLCHTVKSSDHFCTISPLKITKCYRLRMGLCKKDNSCSIKSKPVYISPLDHVKPHPPTIVMAKSESRGVLRIDCVGTEMLDRELQFQYRWRTTNTEEWKVDDSFKSNRGEVVIPDMCKVYIVQVRSMLKSGKGYWSDWSDSVMSTPENSRAPERGPVFWRVRHDVPERNNSTVTLLFESPESFALTWDSYCVDGFIVLHQYSNGSVRAHRMSQLSTYSFDWNQDGQTVIVEAFNSLGTSINNMNLTLKKQPELHRGEPPAYTILMFIFFLCIFLLITIFVCLKRLKRFAWKNVPNPKKCSWAQDLQKVDSFGNLFQSQLLQYLPSEDFSKITCYTSATSSLPVRFDPRVNESLETGALLDQFPSLVISLDALTTNESPVDPLVDRHSCQSESSSKSLVTYAKLHLVGQQDNPTDYSNGSSCIDERISSPIKLETLILVGSNVLKVDRVNDGEIDEIGCSPSSSAIQDISKSSKQKGEAKKEKNLQYSDITWPEEDGESLHEDFVLNKQDCPALHPLLSSQQPSAPTCGFPTLYFPQYRAASIGEKLLM